MIGWVCKFTPVEALKAMGRADLIGRLAAGTQRARLREGDRAIGQNQGRAVQAGVFDHLDLQHVTGAQQIARVLGGHRMRHQREGSRHKRGQAIEELRHGKIRSMLKGLAQHRQQSPDLQAGLARRRGS